MEFVRIQIAALLCSFLGGWLATAAADQPAVTFEKGQGDLSIKIGDGAFASYRYEDGQTTRPFLENVHAPDGTQVTRNQPLRPREDLTDHPSFHPGIWLAFGDVSGADFWRNRDRIRHAGFVEEPRGGPGWGRFAVQNHYESGGRTIAAEITRITIRVRRPGYLLLWDSTLKPTDGSLVFGDQEEMGLGIRVATPLAVVKGGRITNSDGLFDEAHVWGKPADWCAYAGTIQGHRAGVVLLPHPGNFRRSWFHARDYGLLVANPFGRNAFTKGEPSRVVVKNGDALRLRFGVLVFNGEPGYRAVYREFLEEAGKWDR
jgi:hypothetical protein